ncbi:MAG: methyltransferase domain-containing protein [Gammaproteobacteria bacterium]
MSQQQATRHYYDTHPINVEQILDAIQKRGIDLADISEDTLQEYDQDHYGGSDATTLLARKAGIEAHHRVLDVCSGMGGPARWLAHRYGCWVSGIDFTESRYHGARRLTELAKLDQLVDFHLGDATQMPFADASFDIVIGQEAWVHVPDKTRLIAECARVCKPGGVIAFTDILKTAALTVYEQAQLEHDMTYASIASAADYQRLLGQAGFTLLEHDDLGRHWAEILKQRLAMYRGLREPTVQKFGAAHFAHWDRTYSFFVSLFQTGHMSGGRFVARRGR